MRRAYGKRRKRGLLESPWLIPGLAAAGIVGWFGSGHAPEPSSLMSLATFTSSFSKCSAMSSTCVIDGDTIRIRGETIRMMDIDAPETRQAKCASELERGNRATQRLIQLLNSGQVSVVRRGSRDVDQYGRSLRIVQVNGRSAGDVLVSEGLARKWSGQRRPWCS